MTKYIEKVHEKLVELAKLVDGCDTISVVRSSTLGNIIRASYENNEVNLDEYMDLVKKAATISIKFTDCECNKITRK